MRSDMIDPIRIRQREVVSLFHYLTEFISPNFTASYHRFIDDKGAFLFSRNGTFEVAVFNPGGKTNFYLCVIHVASGTIIWSANRDAPISSSCKMELTVQGISIAGQDGNLKWATPPLRSSVHALLLTEMGNLVLLDRFNGSLWESFHYPTDTIVIGQHLPEGAILSSAVSDDDLSTDKFVTIDFRTAQLGASGRFMIRRFSGSDREQEFLGPINDCQIPLICGKIGLCMDTKSNRATCSCPQGFHRVSQNSSGCMPSGRSLPRACDSTSQLNPSALSYSRLGYDMDYFSIDFSEPVRYGVNLSVCQDFCTSDCSCLGIFYANSSGSCYALENDLGSIISSAADDDDDLWGYIKVIVGAASDLNNTYSDQTQQFPVIALVLLPFTGLLLMVALGFLWWRRWKASNREIKLGSYMELADPRLEGRVSSEEVEKLVRIALCCVHEEPSLRPNMVSIVGMLEGCIPLGQPKVESLHFLRFYGRRFAEASMIEQENGQSDFTLFPQANDSTTSTTSDSRICLSYISSQQISGPR
ncbi:hypothetical protein GH714_001612 [Hevea brasiliensis]|uniref:Bulb-type lectin domain-containing protein n=1 Tax=Hevea brasiliensis TaxID=3981 RepID=A0A6A6L8G8_HEVBR|nr:hypothetical protein GH714_001612 [Hevea brasiliensis]